MLEPRPSAQLTLVPLQEPERTSTTTSHALVGVTFTICDVPVAVNLNQTSSFAVPVQGLAANEEVAFNNVPLVVAVQFSSLFTVRLIAPLHSSLAGAMEIAKVPAVPVQPDFDGVTVNVPAVAPLAKSSVMAFVP